MKLHDLVESMEDLPSDYAHTGNTAILPDMNTVSEVCKPTPAEPYNFAVNVGVNINHPCYGVDIWEDMTPKDKEIARGQGYVGIEYLRYILDQSLKEDNTNEPR